MNGPVPVQSALAHVALELAPKLPLTADERHLMETLRGARPASAMTEADKTWLELYLYDRGQSVPPGLLTRIDQHLSDLAAARHAFDRAARRREKAINDVVAAEAELTDALEDLLALGERPLPLGLPLFATFTQTDEDPA